VRLVIQKHVNLQHLSFIHGQFHCSKIFWSVWEISYGRWLGLEMSRVESNLS